MSALYHDDLFGFAFWQIDEISGWLGDRFINAILGHGIIIYVFRSNLLKIIF